MDADIITSVSTKGADEINSSFCFAGFPFLDTGGKSRFHFIEVRRV